MNIKLSDSQRLVLSTASQRPDGGVFPITLKLKGNAVGNILKSLLTKQLLDEVPGRDDDTVWRYDDGAPLTLRINDAGLQAIGVEDGAPEPDAATEPQGIDADPELLQEVEAAEQTFTAPKPKRTRENSKQAQVIELLRRPEGATIPQIMAATGWQSHTVRGFLAGACKKKLGLDVTSEKPEKGADRVYRLLAG